MCATFADQPAPDVSATPASAHKPVAIFVCHGMGQQVHFETIEGVVNALLREQGLRTPQTTTKPGLLQRLAARPPRTPRKAGAELFKLGDRTVLRGYLTLGTDVAQREVHIYEGYWAPLTEGKIGVWQVLGFLLSAAGLGIWNCLRNGRFIRFMFNKKEVFRGLHLFSMAMLAGLTYVTLLLLVGPVLLASVVTLTSMLSLLFSADTAGWIASPMVAAETWYVARIEIFLFALGVATVVLPKLYSWFRRKMFLVQILGWMIRAASFALALWSLAGAGLTAGLAFVRFGVYAAKNVAGMKPDVANLMQPSRWHLKPGPHFLHAWLHILLTVFARFTGLPSGFLRVVLVWILAFVFGYFIRWFLIEYAGDVAIYTSSYTVSDFDEVRDKIRSTVLAAARPVYAARVGDQKEGPFLYDHVIVVGHSLGSVIAYDTLNSLLCEDKLSKTPISVDKRTHLFLTFGSPLDKTAFIFRTHSSKTYDFREEAAEQFQPLIQAYENRPDRWINIWSPMDIISGRLKYYDDTDQNAGGGKRVINQWDKQAWVIFAAHTEYWNNSLFAKTLHDAILRTP
jgi:hypothetical protein